MGLGGPVLDERMVLRLRYLVLARRVVGLSDRFVCFQSFDTYEMLHDLYDTMRYDGLREIVVVQVNLKSLCLAIQNYACLGILGISNLNGLRGKAPPTPSLSANASYHPPCSHDPPLYYHTNSLSLPGSSPV
jgi:hypothetical protein